VISTVNPPPSTDYPLQGERDIVAARQVVRRLATDLKFSLVDQTKLVTAASELARNTVVYGLGGIMRVEQVSNRGKPGIRLTFEDEGPGIPDVERALSDGYTSGSGMGLGLGGARRLCNEFSIESTPGKGTRVTVTRWK